MCACVCVWLTSCVKVSNNRHTHSATLGTLFCVDLGFDACVGVIGFACPTSWHPPPVTVRSFLWAPDRPPATPLVFLHVLAAPNTTEEEEWEGYEACVRVRAALDAMSLKGLCCCVHCHCLNVQRVLVWSPVITAIYSPACERCLWTNCTWSWGLLGQYFQIRIGKMLQVQLEPGQLIIILDVFWPLELFAPETFFGHQKILSRIQDFKVKRDCDRKSLSVSCGSDRGDSACILS